MGNSRNQSEQRALLEKRKSRKIFEQIRDDSSSLVVLYDSASFITGLTNVTETSSKLSLKFRFDWELLQSTIYQGTVRSLLRRAIHGSNESKVISESAKSFSQPDQPIRDTSAVGLSKIDDSILEDEMEYEMEPWEKITLAASVEDLSTIIIFSWTSTHKCPMDRLRNFASRMTGGLNLATLDYNKFCFLEYLEDSRAPPPWMALRKCVLFWSTGSDVPRIQDKVSDLRGITVIVFTYDFSLYKWSGLEEPFTDTLRIELERFRKFLTLRGFYKIEKFVFLFIVDFFPEKIISKPLGQHPDLVSGGSWALAAYSIFKEFLKSNLPDKQTLSYIISSSNSFL